MKRRTKIIIWIFIVIAILLAFIGLILGFDAAINKGYMRYLNG